MSRVRFLEGESLNVQNLGWLLRHASEVYRFLVIEREDGGAELVASLEGVGVHERRAEFRTTFGSATVLAGWLERPRFHGVDVLWREVDGGYKGGKVGGGALSKIL